MNIVERLLNNFKADLQFLTEPRITFTNRIVFLVGKYLSILLNLRHVAYLGKEFNYDSRVGPLLLQFYPREVVLQDKVINLGKLTTVLDVGANAGQWAFTLKSFFPKIVIYSFEPNKKVFSMLKKNSQSYKDWKTFNFAIGKKNELRKLFFTEDSTVGGSFYKKIASEFLPNSKVKSEGVKVIKLDYQKIKKLGLPTKVDLVKIDVEGAELEVLEALKTITFKYLVVEVPLKSKRETSVEGVKKIVNKNFNKTPRLLSLKPVGNLGIVADAIFKMS